MKLSASLYCGALFDDNTVVLIPHNVTHLSSIWSYCSSEQFKVDIRALEPAMKVRGTIVKAPFDLDLWQKVAAEKYPNGLPAPQSDDPTQWLFKGDIVTSTYPLQVAVSRLLGHRWPDQPKERDAIEALAHPEGIVCIPGIRGELSAAERLLELLRAAYASDWTENRLHSLLSEAGARPDASLDDWLRNQFFEQHCQRFHQRPFVWHIWDGRKDGFACLVNYHKLNHKALENLAYSYLGDWITAQAGDARSGKTGADLRLAAAQELQKKLKLILAGEEPYDIFVRWKPLAEQGIGWQPDLNDGVRMNIRPFMIADVLRKKPNIKWSKDRGQEPDRPRDDFPWFWNGDTFTGERVNDVHLTLAAKQVAASRRPVSATSTAGVSE